MTRGSAGWSRAGLFLLLSLALAIGVAACSGPRQLYPSSYRVPPEAPPHPKRRPTPPAGFQTAAVQAQKDQAAAAAKTVPLQPYEISGDPGKALSPLAATAVAGASASTQDSRYKVLLGDTLYAVSRQSNVPIRAIIDANGLTPPFDLQAGQVLIIPRARIHLVGAGDTVYGISRRYGVEMSELVRLNAVQAPYAIAKGQRLVLPGPSGAEASPVPDQTAPEAAASGGSASTLESDTVDPGPSAAPEDSGRQTRLAALPKLPKRESDRFLWPVQGKVVARYGPRASGQHNDGINILAPRGAAIQAAENGVVVYAGDELRGFGRLLLIKHEGGWVTAYAHAESLLVKRGQTVRRGQTIARVGSSGNVARPQLHFEIRKGTRALDPMRLLVSR